eukprot:TRINITY_DN10219_c0_g2_i1.p1 TRINITY_DN10219_c0_g2~~TRINITY_DN10219_c0_g2_i1.p1  ORF type:complete len:247 (+),score=44.30 TRINITY_DN10219_c0_g2_i1:87-743(+)
MEKQIKRKVPLAVAVLVLIWWAFRVEDGHNKEGGDLIEEIEMRDKMDHTPLRLISIREAHTKGKVHRGVWVFVTDSRKRMFFIKRAAHMKTCPSAWVTIGEHCQPSETWKQTALRGLREELGWTNPQEGVTQVGPPFLFNNTYTNGKVDKQWTVIFHTTVQADNIPAYTLSKEEISDSVWMDPEEFMRERLSEATPQCDAYTQRMVFEHGVRQVMHVM